MKRIFSLAYLFVLFFFLAACTAAPKVAFTPQAKQSIKKIAIVELPEPDVYHLFPNPLPGGASLYMFGALGGAILGGIESNRHEKASTQFTTMLKPMKPELSNLFIQQIEQGLRAKGYETVRIPAASKKENGDGYDFSKTRGVFDAVLVTSLSAGYMEASTTAHPRIVMTAELHPRKGEHILFSDSYLYANSEALRYVFIKSDPAFSKPTADVTSAKTPLALNALRTGSIKLADRLVQDL